MSDYGSPAMLEGPPFLEYISESFLRKEVS